MNAAAPAYGVVDLVRFETRDVESQLASLNWKKTFLEWCQSVPFRLLAKFVSSRIELVAQRLATQAAAFNGIRSRVEETMRNEAIDPAFELAGMLSSIQKDVLAVRDNTWFLVELREKRGAKYVEITAALKRVAMTANELFDVVEQLRYAVLAHDEGSGLFARDPVFAKLAASAAAMTAGTAALTSEDYSDLDADLHEEARKTVEAVATKH